MTSNVPNKIFAIFTETYDFLTRVSGCSKTGRNSDGISLLIKSHNSWRILAIKHGLLVDVKVIGTDWQRTFSWIFTCNFEIFNFIDFFFAMDISSSSILTISFCLVKW